MIEEFSDFQYLIMFVFCFNFNCTIWYFFWFDNDSIIAIHISIITCMKYWKYQIVTRVNIQAQHI